MDDPLEIGRCTDCSNSYESLGRHISQSSCEYPELTSRQKQIIEGCLLGDGNIDSHNRGYPRFRLGSVKPKFLSWVRNELHNIMNKTGVSIQDSDDDSNHQDYYMLRTIPHPYFKKLRTWYKSGSKILPRRRFTPMELKMWYVTDGGRMDTVPCIRMDNERQNIYQHKDNIESLGIECSVVADDRQITILKGGRDRFFEYMGAPVPGFEYKWPDE